MKVQNLITSSVAVRFSAHNCRKSPTFSRRTFDVYLRTLTITKTFKCVLIKKIKTFANNRYNNMVRVRIYSRLPVNVIMCVYYKLTDATYATDQM